MGKSSFSVARKESERSHKSSERGFFVLRPIRYFLSACACFSYGRVGETDLERETTVRPFRPAAAAAGAAGGGCGGGGGGEAGEKGAPRSIPSCTISLAHKRSHQVGGGGGRREKESPSHEKKKPDGKSRGETPLGKGEEEESARRRSVGPAPSSEGEEMGASPLLLVGRGSLRRRKVAWASGSKARSRAEDGAARTGSPLFGAGLTSSSPLGAYLGAFLPSPQSRLFPFLWRVV